MAKRKKKKRKKSTLVKGKARKNSKLRKAEKYSIILGIVAIIIPIGYANYSENNIIKKMVKYSDRHNLNIDPLKEAASRIRNPYVEGLRALDEGRIPDAEKNLLEALDNANENGERGAIRLAVAQVFFEKGNYKTAREECVIIMELLKNNNEIRTKAWTFNMLGLIENKSGNPEKALDYYNKGLEFAREIKADDVTGGILHNIGVLYKYKGELDVALKYFRKSLLINRRIGKYSAIGANLNNIGLILGQKGEYEVAEDTLKEACSVYKRISIPKDEINPLFNLGKIYMYKNEPKKALTCFKTALVKAESTRDYRKMNTIKRNITRAEFSINKRAEEK